MSKNNIFENTKRDTWMTDSLEKQLRKIAKDGRINCAQAQQFASTHNIPLNKMRQFMDVMELKVQNCQLGCF
jgi:hypothetical protein